MAGSSSPTSAASRGSRVTTSRTPARSSPSSRRTISPASSCTWQAIPPLSAQFDVVNGWQNISETNSGKAVGARLDWVASPKVTLSAYNLHRQRGTRHRRRATPHLSGGERQDRADREADAAWGHSTSARRTWWRETGRWYGASIIAHVQATPRTALVARVERYADPKQVIIVTGVTDAFKANGASLGIDATPAPSVMWRTELRTLAGRDAVFPGRDGVYEGRYLPRVLARSHVLSAPDA